MTAPCGTLCVRTHRRRSAPAGRRHLTLLWHGVMVRAVAMRTSRPKSDVRNPSSAGSPGAGRPTAPVFRPLRISRVFVFRREPSSVSIRPPHTIPALPDPGFIGGVCFLRFLLTTSDGKIGCKLSAMVSCLQPRGRQITSFRAALPILGVARESDRSMSFVSNPIDRFDCEAASRASSEQPASDLP